MGGSYRTARAAKKIKREKKRKKEKEKKRKREKRKRGKREREKRKKRKRPTLEMASKGPQRITEKYYGVYLPSYIIYPFAINLSICHTICNLSTVLIHL